MKSKYRPSPSVNFSRQIADASVYTFMATASGEHTTQKTGMPLGAVGFGGTVKNVWLSVGASGKDDSNDLYIEADVKINGATCLTTKPKIAHVSGEASQQKTTVTLGDTGITQCDILETSATFNAGDVFTYNMELTRTASPTTEMATPCLVVELMPE